MWLVGVVVRRYIDFLILLISTLVSVLFCSSILIGVYGLYDKNENILLLKK